jgi:hypothetical protein
MRIIVSVTLYVIFAFIQINMSLGNMVIDGGLDDATIK